LGGLSLFGITGFVLGPVVAALFIAVWQMYEQDRAGIEGEPESTVVTNVTGEPIVMAENLDVSDPRR